MPQINKEIKEIEIRITTKDVIDIENWEDEGGSLSAIKMETEADQEYADGQFSSFDNMDDFINDLESNVKTKQT